MEARSYCAIMSRLACIFVLVSLAVCQNIEGDVAVRRIEKIYASKDGRVHLVSCGREILAPKQDREVRAVSAKLASDGRTAGWLSESDDCCTSYPLPLLVVIYRGGRVIQRFATGQSIWDWQFVEKGKQVAFWTGPTHGNYTPHFELRDIDTGKLVASWDGHVREKHPDWVSGLKE
jgi:hypothetical protein